MSVYCYGFVNELFPNNKLHKHIRSVAYYIRQSPKIQQVINGRLYFIDDIKYDASSIKLNKILLSFLSNDTINASLLKRYYTQVKICVLTIQTQSIINYVIDLNAMTVNGNKILFDLISFRPAEVINFDSDSDIIVENVITHTEASKESSDV